MSIPRSSNSLALGSQPSLSLLGCLSWGPCAAGWAQSSGCSQTWVPPASGVLGSQQVPVSRLESALGSPTTPWKDAVETRQWEKWVSTPPASEEVGCKRNQDSEQNESDVFVQVDTGHSSTMWNHHTIQNRWQELLRERRHRGPPSQRWGGTGRAEQGHFCHMMLGARCCSLSCFQVSYLQKQMELEATMYPIRPAKTCSWITD